MVSKQKNDYEFFVIYDLQFFAKDGPGGERTEEPTPRKLEDAREEGQVARSNELITSSTLLAMFLSLKVFLGYMNGHFVDAFRLVYNNISIYAKEEFTTNVGQALLNEAGKTILKICLPLLVIGVIVSFTVVLFQVKWKVSGKLIQPKFDKLSIISGFKRMFSMDKIVQLIVSVVKVIIIAYIVYDTLIEEWDTLLLFYNLNLEQSIALIGQIVLDLGIKISLIFLIIGLADYIYQKIKFKSEMRMTKQELKDEMKNTEGDPQVKGKIKQRMREASQRRMMQDIPQADVVITNPTHFAVAIKYDRDKAEAPLLLAKGADHLAHKIKELAKDSGVEIVENKPLARMLYYNVDIGDEIPPELYQMTAEVLAYVYGLQNKI